jgi:hypothetical protein
VTYVKNGIRGPILGVAVYVDTIIAGTIYGEIKEYTWTHLG